MDGGSRISTGTWSQNYVKPYLQGGQIEWNVNSTTTTEAYTIEMKTKYKYGQRIKIANVA